MMLPECVSRSVYQCQDQVQQEGNSLECVPISIVDKTREEKN